MGLATGIAVYVVIWWIVIFAVLPFGVRTPDEVEQGHATSAPIRPRIGLKMLITTGISAVIWVLVHAIVQSDLLSFRAP
jgi:predicted secreted protein